jgi:signal transduction histidine kinase
VVAAVLAVETLSSLSQSMTVEQAFPHHLSLLWADGEKAKQSVLHVCKNAVEAMPTGGRLSVSPSNSGGQVSWEIHATGVGIPAGVAIFEPFLTTKAKRTGLALTLGCQSVAAQNGTLTAHRSPGQETMFTLVLPVLHELKVRALCYRSCQSG